MPTSSQGEANGQSEPSKTIVVVEDDHYTRNLFKLLLSEETSYTVLPLRNGIETLEAIEEIVKLQPNLFLLDYRLPPMNAISLYDRLHAIKELEHVPAIIITADRPGPASEELKKRNLTLIYKPFNVSDLLMVVDQVIA